MFLLTPLSIAVIGASATEGKVGHDVLKNLLTQGFKGAVYPVNPKGGEILGEKVFASVKDIDATVDLAIIITPAATVPGVMQECAENSIKAVIVISAGFKETGSAEGKKLEEEVRAIAKKYSMDVLGPNCLGLLRPGMGLNASFAKELPPAGSIALISQSGAFAVALLDAATACHGEGSRTFESAGSSRTIGYSMVLSIGNKTVLDECDFLERCSEDSETRVIGLYLESIEDGLRFREVAQRVAEKKHVVLIKGGTSSFGKRAAASHTGALAGSDAAIDAVCAQTGIHRAHSLEEFTDLLQILSTQPSLLTPRIAIITNAGGPGILAADAAEREGLLLPSLTEMQEKKLREKLPPTAGIKNPIDIIGDAGADRYQAALEACIDDPTIDGLVILLTPQVMTPVEEIAKTIIEAGKKNSLMPIVTSFMGYQSVHSARALLAQHGIANFETPERAVHAIAALMQNGPQPRRAAAEVLYPEASPSRVRHVRELLHGKVGLLPEDTTLQLLKLYNLPSPEQTLARSVTEACTIAQKIGYPVIAKISSPQILHKTDVGGIRADIETEQELVESFNSIMKNISERAPEAQIRGILIQKFLPVGSELIIGGLRDSSFGPLVMAGLGGIYTELFRDVRFRLAPLLETDAYAMLQELKAWKMLLGLRGKPPANVDALVHILLGVSQMLLECPQIQELDFNPVLIHEEDVTIADAKVIIE